MKTWRAWFLASSGILLTGLLSALALWWPMFRRAEVSGWGDWQQFHHWWEVGRIALLRWGEWPLWDPHHCGGVSQWGQPQAQNFSPFYLALALPFGTTWGHKLYILVHHMFGWAGTYVVGRRHHGLSRAGGFLAATIWTSSGVACWDGAGGHSTFLAFAWLPWMLFAWREALKDVRYTVLLAALVTEVLLEGGTYPLPFSVLVLAFDTLIRVEKKTLLPMVKAGVLSVVLTLFLAAIRWAPIYLQMSRNPRPASDSDALSFAEIVTMWTSRNHDWGFEGHTWVWPEYGSYVGWGVLAFVAVGIVVALREARSKTYARRWPLMLVAGFALFLAFSMGNHGPYWPFPLFAQRLPGIGSLRVPSRWQVVCTLYLAWLAGLALTAFDRWWARRELSRDVEWFRPFAPFVIALALAVDLVATGIGITDRWDGQPVGNTLPERPHLVGPEGYLEGYANYPGRNVGTMECYDPVPWVRSDSLWFGDVPQVRFVEPGVEHPGVVPTRGGDTLYRYTRTNHTVWIDVELPTPGRLIFNQNYDAQWRATAGELTVDDHRLALELPAGRHRVSLYFAPDDLPYSLYASGLGVLLCMTVLVVVPWQRRRRGILR